MARARILKPDFFDDEKLSRIPFQARLLFQALWTLADREGRLEDRPEKITAYTFPYDNPLQVKARKEAPGMLDVLVEAQLVERYEVDGEKCLWLPHFKDHQKTHEREAKSALPPAPGEKRFAQGEQRRAQGEPRSAQGMKSPPEAEAVIDPVTEAEAETREHALAGAAGPFTAEELETFKRSKTTAVRCYEQMFGIGTINGFIAPDLKEIDAEWEDECIEHCFREAAASNGQSLKFIRAILDRHKREGCYAKARQPVTSSGGYLDATERFEQRLKAGT